VQGTSVVDVAKGVFGSTLMQIAGVLGIGVVATAFVVTIGPSGNPATPSPTFTPPVSGSFLKKLQERDALAIAFCREAATLHTSPRRTSAQWRRYLGIQAFLATDGRRLDRDRLFGAALAAAKDDSAKQSAYVRGCTRAGLPPE
jgi:hypothetical protein